MANKRIKGLTVEIGGDTTKLGKALDNIENKGRDLSKELGEINRLLKLDPGNVDLLAQKQKVLADAVDNTSEKLATLREAEKQVQKQFERGEVSEEQVRALRREIVKTEQQLDKFQKEAKQTGKSLDDMADAADKAERESEGLGKTLGSVAKGGLAALAAGVTALLGGLIGSAEATRDYRREMGKLDTAFTTNGHSAEAAKTTYESLQGVLGETDQAVEAANHLALLTDNEKDLSTWTHTLTGVYATFGASLPIEGLTEAANETAKVGKVTGPLADALNWAGVSEDAFNESLAACTDEQERQQLIMDTLNGLYSEAADAYKETNAEVIRANEANEEWTASLAEVGGAMEPLLTDVKLLGASLLSDFLPGVKSVAEALRGVLNGEAGSAEALGAALSGIIEQLVSKVNELIPVVAQTALSLITTLITSLLGQLPTIINTIFTVIQQLAASLAEQLPTLLPAILQGILGIIEALIANLPVLVEALMGIIMGIADALPDMLRAIVDRLPDILNMLLQEVLPQIIKMILEMLPTLINTIVDFLIEAIPLLIDATITLLMAIIDAIPVIIDALVEALPGIITTIINAIINALPQLLNAAVTLLMALVQAIPKIIPILVSKLPSLITAIVGTLLRNLPVLINAAVKLFFGILEAIPQIAAELVKQMPTIIASICEGLLDGVGDIGEIGGQLIEGLWEGIKDMTGWITDKLSGFGDTVLGGIKKFFGIKSPSRVMAKEVGRFLPEGLAKGVEDNADTALDAMTDLSDDMLGEAEQLNGLTLERRLHNTFDPVPGAAESMESGLLSKLDKILAAIEKGQILTIDGESLVGATIDRLDNKLGQRRNLAARGAL